MSATMAIQPAKVVETDGRRWLRCPNCGRTLGELIGHRLVVIVRGYEIKLPAVQGLSLPCQRCGAEHMLDAP